ncbi:MAG: hypothetical protein ABEI39_00170 [Halobacteriales archaeon]
MTRDTSDAVTTVEKFEATLGQLLVSALENDIDPRGTWEYRHDGVGSDLEVLVVELASADD